MSPILVRPVREQLEHDRVIRHLQTKFRRRFDVAINPGAEQNAPVGGGPAAAFPDLVLTALDRGRKIMVIIEVETVESVNNLEALAEWVTFGRLKPALHLYVPTSMMEVAKRLCTDHNVPVAEIHSYHMAGDELRFVPVYRAPADVRTRHAASATKAVPAGRATAPPKPKTAAPVATLRQAQGRPEQRRGAKKPKPAAKAKPKPKSRTKPKPKPVKNTKRK